MQLSLDRWRVRHLTLASVGYWVALAVVKLTPAFIAAWTVTRNGEHGSINASLEGSRLLKVTILRDATVNWSGVVSLATLALWVTGPPLVFWILWLIQASRSRRRAARAQAELQSGDTFSVPQTGHARDVVPLSTREGLRREDPNRL